MFDYLMRYYYYFIKTSIN